MFKKLAIGCGGFIGLVILLGIIITVAAGGSSKSSSGSSSKTPKANAATYTPGATATSKEFSMTLATVTDPYTSPNQFTQPKAGNRYVLYHVSAKNVDKTDHPVNQFSFKVRDTASHVYQPALAVTAGTTFSAQKLSAGDITEGDIVFELPTDAKIASLTYDTGLGSDDLTWKAQ